MLDARQKRTFIALACKVAWADGVVAEEERERVAALVEKLGGQSVSPAELDQWLSTGAPPAELDELPPSIGEMFIYEAFRLCESDGAISDEELGFIEKLVARVAKKHEPGTPVAKIAVRKMEPPK
jgi:tellurite resistance protein